MDSNGLVADEIRAIGNRSRDRVGPSAVVILHDLGGPVSFAAGNDTSQKTRMGNLELYVQSILDDINAERRSDTPYPVQVGGADSSACRTRALCEVGELKPRMKPVLV